MVAFAPSQANHVHNECWLESRLRWIAHMVGTYDSTRTELNSVNDQVNTARYMVFGRIEFNGAELMTACASCAAPIRGGPLPSPPSVCRAALVDARRRGDVEEFCLCSARFKDDDAPRGDWTTHTAQGG